MGFPGLAFPSRYPLAPVVASRGRYWWTIDDIRVPSTTSDHRAGPRGGSTAGLHQFDAMSWLYGHEALEFLGPVQDNVDTGGWPCLGLIRR